MTLTRSIPKAAAGVVKIIRAEVPRPRGMPRKYACKIGGRPLRFMRQDERKCPMGLIPGVSHPTPYWDDQFPNRIGFGDDEIQVFATWWDDQTDAQAATDAVWPKKRRSARKK